MLAQPCTHVPVMESDRLRLRAPFLPDFGWVLRESLPRKDAGDVIIRHDLRGAA